MLTATTAPPSLEKSREYSNEQKAAHLLLSQLDPFAAWLFDHHPSFEWFVSHLQYIRQQLYDVTTGDCNRLMLFLPPRHGKSEMVTIRYAAWVIEQNPKNRVIIGAYNQTLANKFSRKVRKIARERTALSTERTAVEDWETAAGGGLRAVGVGAGVTGMGGNLIIIDDPVKNREEANSPTYRNRVYDWYTDDLYTRQEPNGSIILIMTRWHEDDLAGRILASEQGKDWRVVSLPAIAESDDQLGRAAGDALWPDRFDLAMLEDYKRTLGRSFYGLYQQRPQEQEGSMFKRSNFRFIAESELPEMAASVWWWDKAASEKTGDYSAGGKMSRSKDGRYFVHISVRGQWSTAQRDAVVLSYLQQEGGKTPTWFEQEPGSSGKDVAVYQTRMFAGYPVFFETSSGSKEVRAMPYAAQVEANNVYLVRGPWNSSYIDELTSFSSGLHDDQVDWSSGAFNKVALNLIPAGTMVDDIDLDIYKPQRRQRLMG